MAGKSFEAYAAEYKKAPFEWPMPGGASIPVPQPDLEAELTAIQATTDGKSMLDGVLSYLGPDAAADAAAIREAWGKMPVAALSAVIGDMRRHFGTGN